MQPWRTWPPKSAKAALSPRCTCKHKGGSPALADTSSGERAAEPSCRRGAKRGCLALLLRRPRCWSTRPAGGGVAGWGAVVAAGFGGADDDRTPRSPAAAATVAAVASACEATPCPPRSGASSPSPSAPGSRGTEEGAVSASSAAGCGMGGATAAADGPTAAAAAFSACDVSVSVSVSVSECCSGSGPAGGWLVQQHILRMDSPAAPAPAVSATLAPGLAEAG
jgi:hypothetical protein